MREHEHRRMERRVVAPPPFPVEVFPRSALGSELITPHDFGADVTGEVASAVVVKTVRSPRIGAIDPVRGGSRPGKEIGRIRVAERVLETLAHPRAVAIARHHEIVHTNRLRHEMPPPFTQQIVKSQHTLIRTAQLMGKVDGWT